MLALCATVDPGDEVILFDPYFVAYPHLVTLTGGRAVVIDTYPDFTIDLNRVHDAITPRTKAILVGSPANPSGAVLPQQTVRGLAELARERGVLLISDEIYRVFCYDEPFCSPAEFNPNVLVVDGFGKAYGMTGWRLGFAHGPAVLLNEMAKLQQFTFVCAPSMVQYAGVAACDFDTAGIVADYRRKRDRVYDRLRQRYEIVKPGGAFYCFPRVPGDNASEFVRRAVAANLLVIPGGTFSRRDTHVRVSFAASDATLDRGLDILDRLTGENPLAPGPSLTRGEGGLLPDKLG
jgi:aspartate aminotransferase/aminotransferase